MSARKMLNRPNQSRRMPDREKPCSHSVYIKGLCGNCGARLDPPQSTSVSMIHSVPELKVSEEYAKKLGKSDQQRLIQERKLVLLVDLDQTILHTTHEKVDNDPNVHSFKLWPGHPTYYTKLRPYLKEFLEQMSKLYELHIFTFGCRLYAHKIASIIDPNRKYFGTRILSRDESVDQYSKKGNLKSLFPSGDAMVCIIDDRSDVWRDAGNLIQVKPYVYFKTSISDGSFSSISELMRAHEGLSDEDDESLDKDVDALEALLGLEDDDKGEKKGADEDEEARRKKLKCDPDGDGQEASADTSSSTQKGGQSGETPDANVDLQERKEEVVVTTTSTADKIQDDAGNEKKKEPDEADGWGETSSQDEESSQDKPASAKVNHDPDEHLLRLTTILSWIHEKWYMELDEQRQFLLEGESYKLPDIKDVIKRYLRKKY